MSIVPSLPPGGEEGRDSVAILASRATRPVRWRRQLRAACFWLALGLGTAAAARELGASAYYALCVPPLARQRRPRTQRHLGRWTHPDERRCVRADRAWYGRRLRELDGAGRLRRGRARGTAAVAHPTRGGLGASGAGRRRRAHPAPGGRGLADPSRADRDTRRERAGYSMS